MTVMSLQDSSVVHAHAQAVKGRSGCERGLGFHRS